MNIVNARLVLPDSVQPGGITVENGLIAKLDAVNGDDWDNDFLLPGIIDLHTDNLERQVLPRSNARWPSRSALLSHDAQCAAAGITTVFDALCLGDIGFEKARNQTFTDGLADLRDLAPSGALKCEHFLHLRCELPAPEMPELLSLAIDDPLVRFISIMDHSPGLGQYSDIERYRAMRAADGFSKSEIDELVMHLQANHHSYHVPNRKLVIAEAAERGLPIASHDDRTVEEIDRNAAEGLKISEFPVSLAAAQRAHARGLRTIAGAPNIVRGGSHSGNVAVLDLIRAGVLDALASDYVPAAMLEAAFAAATLDLISLHAAIALITAGPADIAILSDRGRIAPGLRADFLRVRLHDSMPVIREVFRNGQRIA